MSATIGTIFFAHLGIFCKARQIEEFSVAQDPLFTELFALTHNVHYNTLYQRETDSGGSENGSSFKNSTMHDCFASFNHAKVFKDLKTYNVHHL